MVVVRAGRISCRAGIEPSAPEPASSEQFRSMPALNRDWFLGPDARGKRAVRSNFGQRGVAPPHRGGGQVGARGSTVPFSNNGCRGSEREPVNGVIKETEEHREVRGRLGFRDKFWRSPSPPSRGFLRGGESQTSQRSPAGLLRVVGAGGFFKRRKISRLGAETR